jgi:hypothetical protein
MKLELQLFTAVLRSRNNKEPHHFGRAAAVTAAAALAETPAAPSPNWNITWIRKLYKIIHI